MGNQQLRLEESKVQRLERNLVPASVGKWGESYYVYYTIVAYCAIEK